MNLNFEASGSLWQDALVMRDRETGSLWSQVSGICISGEMEKMRLSLSPSFITTFEEFVKKYPGGKLLKKPEKGESGSHYRGYFESKEKLGIFGRINNFEKLEGKEYIFGLRLENSEVAISRKYLENNNFALIEQNVFVLYNSNNQTATAFKAIDDYKIIGYENDKLVLAKDGQKHSIKADSDMDGDKLKRIALIPAFWFAWISFFPKTNLINK